MAGPFRIEYAGAFYQSHHEVMGVRISMLKTRIELYSWRCCRQSASALTGKFMLIAL